MTLHSLKKTLKNNFNFNVEKLINPKRSEITKKLNKLKNKLSPDDSLIIYFAGHGKKLENEGFWLPSDAEINDDTNWISNEYITRKIKSYSAKKYLSNC